VSTQELARLLHELFVKQKKLIEMEVTETNTAMKRWSSAVASALSSSSTSTTENNEKTNNNNKTRAKLLSLKGNPSRRHLQRINTYIKAIIDGSHCRKNRLSYPTQVLHLFYTHLVWTCFNKIEYDVKGKDQPASDSDDNDDSDDDDDDDDMCTLHSQHTHICAEISIFMNRFHISKRFHYWSFLHVLFDVVGDQTHTMRQRLAKRKKKNSKKKYKQQLQVSQALSKTFRYQTGALTVPCVVDDTNSIVDVFETTIDKLSISVSFSTVEMSVHDINFQQQTLLTLVKYMGMWLSDYHNANPKIVQRFFLIYLQLLDIDREAREQKRRNVERENLMLRVLCETKSDGLHLRRTLNR